MMNDLPALGCLAETERIPGEEQVGRSRAPGPEIGSVAVTNHSAVEMVVLDVSTYRQLTEDIQTLKAREQTVLNELAQRFDARLAVLQQPDANRKLAAVFESRGKLGQRPKAGATF